MRNVICDKMAALEKEISAEKGDFYLFALFCREDAADRWDLVVASPWLEADEKQGLNYLADKVRVALTEEELLSLSKIVVLEADNPVVDAVRKSVQETRHGRIELQNQDFAGVQVAHVCISTSTAPDISVRQSGR
jgi:hypothetical protein